uniref:Uncharacterized protein n=1 Tax=Ditylenchus dipsaci TaxID=166011 RepID=A0A915E5A6_9BILA
MVNRSLTKRVGARLSEGARLLEGARSLKEILDRRSHYTLFGDELAPLDLATARLVQKARKMDDYFETGGILKNNKHDYLLLEKLGPTEFKVSETKTDKIYFLKVEAGKMPSQGPKLARHVHIMLESRNTNPLFRRHLLKMTDRGIIEGSYNFILTRFAGPSLEDLRRKGAQGQQFTPSTALRGSSKLRGSASQDSAITSAGVKGSEPGR